MTLWAVNSFKEKIKKRQQEIPKIAPEAVEVVK